MFSAFAWAFVAAAAGSLAATPGSAAPPPAPEATAPAHVQIGDVTLVPAALLRVRGESVPDRTLVGDANRLVLTHRARIGGKASVEPFDLVITVQDVRAWGSERVPDATTDPTLFGKVADGLQLYEAYVGLHLGDDLEARIGRQAISMANERLIGKAEFTMPGRAYDAIRLLGTTDTTSWSVFGAIIANAQTALDGADHYLGAAFLELKPTSWARISPALIADIAIRPGSATPGRQRTTFGTRIDGGAGGLGYDVEGWLQTTRTEDSVVTLGVLTAARVTYEMDTMLHPKVGLTNQVVSGNETGVVGAPGLAPFDTINGTNHAHYGHADIFINLPLHTKGQGVVDTAAAFWLHEGPWSGLFALHAFTPFAYAGADVPFYGVEPDVFGQWKANAHLAFEGGCALFIPTGTSLGRGQSPAAWAYLQVQAWL